MENQYITLWSGDILATEVIKASMSVLRSAARAIFRDRLLSKIQDLNHIEMSPDVKK